MNKVPYPQSPAKPAEQLREISPAYQQKVIKAFLSIVLFIAAYLAVFILSLAFLVAAVFLAAAVIGFLTHWIGLLLAGGILITAGMFFYFIVKFLFQSRKDTDNSRIEIFEKDQPLLFEFIRKVCGETHVPFPKKIVLTPHVNAGVYYNQSFLSLFFSMDKNLEIGAALLNCVTLTEFKAVLAHEFGHFSQSGMRLGSYIYRFNRIVHNLLFENEDWLAVLNSVTKLHSFLAIFSHITVWLVKGVMSLFTAIYKTMNMSYLALSREMEFHADSVAVSVTGSRPIISALYRLELGQEAYNYTLSRMAGYQKDRTVYAANFFALHQHSINFLAKQNDLPVENGFPVITSEITAVKIPQNRLQYKDVWASHPSIKDREQNALRIQLEGEQIDKSPWLLFSNAGSIQEKLSQRIPELAQSKQDKLLVDNGTLLHYFEKEEKENEKNPLYADYYTYASNVIEPPVAGLSEGLSKEGMKFLFNADRVLLLKGYYNDRADTETLRLISSGHLPVKQFYLDGVSYTRYYSKEIYDRLRSETEIKAGQIKEHNKKISNWFYVMAFEKNKELAEAYDQLLVFNKRFNEDVDRIAFFIEELVKLYNEEILKYTDQDDLPRHVKRLKDIYASFIKTKDEMENLPVPACLLNDPLFEKGYKNTLFGSEVRDPGMDTGLNGFNALYEDLSQIIERLRPFMNLLQKQMLKLQDEILEAAQLA